MSESRRTYEEMDGPVRGVLGFGLVLATLVLFSLGLLQGLFSFFRVRSEAREVPRHPLAEETVTPPEPRLLADPDGYYEVYAEEQRDRLARPAWIDESGGVVRLPVERALERVLEEGLPVR